jgi:hypothetical protein
MVYNKMSELERKWELPHKNTIHNLFHQKIPNQKTQVILFHQNPSHHKVFTRIWAKMWINKP